MRVISRVFRAVGSPVRWVRMWWSQTWGYRGPDYGYRLDWWK